MKVNLIYRLSTIFVIAVAVLVIQGCKKYLDVNTPQDQMLTSTVFESNGTANAAILNIYGRMFSQLPSPYNLSYVAAISADELKTYATANLNMYTNTLLATDGNVSNYWNTPYNYIYQANAVYEGCAGSSTLDPDVKAQIMAEALFIRAYWHFYLYNLFGDVPIITSTDYRLNTLVVRRSKADVYAQIITDLNTAIPMLKSSYVAADGISSSLERIRPNKFTAIALLARVYLYNEEYVKAEAQASLLIANKEQYDTVPLTAVFLANSKEAIWQLKANNINIYDTPEANQYILTASPVTSSASELSSQLLAAFDSADLRKATWIGSFTDNVKTYYYPAKYKIKNGLDYKEYSMIFRLAEQYLIRAEARAQQNNLAGAIADIDVIKDRAKIAKISIANPGIGKADLLNEILGERQRELFTEGHRWFDLKRTGRVNDVMTAVMTAKGGPAWNSNKQLWPIPQVEIFANPKLTQNNGYN